MTSTFPVNYALLSADILETRILPSFGLQDVSECLFYSGGFNDTYRVKTGNGQTYYLRAYRRSWRRLADIQYELDLLVHLQQKDFPAARLVPFQDGKLFCAVHAPEGTRYLALFTECPGPEVTYDNEPDKVARRYGQAVAEMHIALDDFSSLHGRFHKDLAHFIDMPLANVAPFLKHRPDDWAYFQDFAERVGSEILDLPADDLEKGACHGDLQGYHANVGPDGRLTFFDFDCGGFGYRAYDLAVFLWCCRLEDAIDVRWEPFLDAYRKTRPIGDLDVEAVALFVCCRYLWHMGVQTQNAPYWGVGGLNDNYFDTHMMRLHQAEQDYLVSSR